MANFYRWDATDTVTRMRADVRIGSSDDSLAHTLAYLPGPHNSKSNLISAKLACYDFMKIFLEDDRAVIRARRGWILDDG